MTILPHGFNELIDLTNLESIKLDLILSNLKSLIDHFLTEFKNNKLSLTGVSFDRNSKSGLTGKAGLYFIVNPIQQKVSFGCCGDLAQRKGEHKRDLNNSASEASGGKTKLPLSMREDLNKGSVSDFYFVPFMIFSNIIPNYQILGTQTEKQQISKFLTKQFEEPLLDHFRNLYPDLFYNVKSTSDFLPGNTFQKAGSGGSPRTPIVFENYAWESKSAVANSFGVTTKAVRHHVKSGLLKEISKDDFANFPGIKVFTSTAESFSSDMPDECKNLRLKLFPRTINRD